MSRITFIALFLVVVLSFISCQPVPESDKAITDPLPSWNDTDSRQAILAFLDKVTTEGSENFIPVADRIAVFDNDGTLWSEKPFYFQLFFTLDLVREMADQHPEWKEEQPFKAVLENDMPALMEQGEHGLVKLVLATHGGQTTEEFESMVNDWIQSANHPRFDRPFSDLVYQPMLELITLLNDNEFKVYIVSGGGIEFMRAWAEDVYDIPRDRIIGSSVLTEFTTEDGKPVIKRLGEMDFITDKGGKPVAINKFIGRKPVFCAGNSDGDLAMMQWTASNALPFFNLYVHHTDSVREWQYDRNSSVGRFDKALDIAREQNWSVVSMQDDWKVIYPFEK